MMQATRFIVKEINACQTQNHKQSQNHKTKTAPAKTSRGKANLAKAKATHLDSPAGKVLPDEISDEMVFTGAGITKSQMMGMPCLKIGGKMFAGYWTDAMVLKLSGEAHQKALALSGAKLFDPSDMNRPMKEWVVIPYAHRAKWRYTFKLL